MTFAPGEECEFYRFLSKFELLDRIPWAPSSIIDSVAAVCAELDRESIDYCFLDLSVNKYLKELTMDEAILLIYNAFNQFRPNKVGLVLSIKYESEPTDKYLEMLRRPEIADCFVGIDLVGDERVFDPSVYEETFKMWRLAGKFTRAHVGESQSADNIMMAIEQLKCTNIAHGLKVIDHPEIIRAALDNDVVFDLGISSNYLSGVWTDDHYHPVVRMLELGLPVTIGTDDPVQCSTTLEREFALLYDMFGVTLDEIEGIRERAIQSAERWMK